MLPACMFPLLKTRLSETQFGENFIEPSSQKPTGKGFFHIKNINSTLQEMKKIK